MRIADTEYHALQRIECQTYATLIHFQEIAQKLHQLTTNIETTCTTVSKALTSSLAQQSHSDTISANLAVISAKIENVIGTLGLFGPVLSDIALSTST